MAVEDSVVAERIRAIQAEEGGDTDKARYRIAQEAKAAGVTGDQIARALGGDLTGSQVNEMARAVGVGLPGYTPPPGAGVADRSGILNVVTSGGGQSPAGGGQGPSGGLTAEEERFMANLPENLRQTYSDLMMAQKGGQFSSSIQGLLEAGMTPSELIYATGGYQPQTYEEAVSVIDRALAEGTIDPATAAYAKQQIQLQPAGAGADAGAGAGAGGYTLSEAEQNYLSGLEGELATIYNIWATGIGSGRSHGEMIDELRGMGYNYDQIMRAVGLGGVGAGTGGLGDVGTEQPAETPTGGFQYQPYQYTQFPQAQGGVYGPGEGMPSIFTPITPPATGTAATETGTSVPGTTTMMSPAVTTYAYPSPFSGVNIFERPGPTPYVPSETNTGSSLGSSLAGNVSSVLGNKFFG